MRHVIVLNGPNLARLGSREPEIYGSVDYATLEQRLQEWARELNVRVEVKQSDDETDLVRWLHQAVDAGTPVILNPAAFTHYSYALRDAAAQLTGRDVPLIEVHISNPAAREHFRQHSVISPVASGTIAGFGLNSYRLALSALA